jgi:hypothetical protein
VSTRAIQAELEYFEKIKPELLKTHRGKVALVKGVSLIDTFTTMEEAYKEGLKRFGTNPFLIRVIEDITPEQKIPALTAYLISARL